MEKEKKLEFHEKNLERVNYWLQFAETKNAAVIAFIVAILAVIYTSMLINNKALLIIISIVYVVSLILAISSLFPQYKKDVSRADGIYKDGVDNFLFWKDLAKYSAEDYIKGVNKVLFEEGNSSISKQEMAYAEEIITNARIAQYKYAMFEKSVIAAIVGTIMIPVFLIIVA